jgi:deoxyribodipyrimidine photo-lyase
MQSGVTHCVDQTWTRIYNPGQVAVDRCDPDGIFIKRWLPELKHLPPPSLGSPLPMKGYPAPILDYKQARKQRVQQLQQRQQFLGLENIVPHLSRLPASLLPFGAERFDAEVSWATIAAPDLYPLALELDALDPEQAKALRTWFVAHVDTKPRKATCRKPEPEPGDLQLSLL